MVLMYEHTPPPGPLWNGLDEAIVEGFSRINKLKEKIIIFTPSMSITIIARLPSAMIAKTALIAVNGLP
jgi:hypothetical protein